MLLAARPHAARERHRRLAGHRQRRHRVCEGFEPVVDPQVRVRDCGAVRRVVAVLAVAAGRALAVGLVEPVRRDALIIVARLEELLPDKVAACLGGGVDGVATQVRVDEAAAAVEQAVLRGLALGLGPEGEGHGGVELLLDAVRQRLDAGVAVRVRREVAVEVLVLVVHDDDTHREVERLVAVAHGEHDVGALVAVAALPEDHGVLAERRRVPGRVRVLLVDRARRGAGGDPDVEAERRVGLPVHAAFALGAVAGQA